MNKKYLIILLIIFSITLLVIPLTAQNTKTFQIASAGSDGIFGTVDDVYTVGGKVDRGISPHNVNESLTAAFSGKKKKDKSQPAIPEGYIEISTAEQLASIGTDENYPLGGSYFMTADIDLSGYSNWNPIGNYGADSESKFTGIFDGNNHVVSNLTISRSLDHQGLFGYVDGAEIENLGLENVDVTGKRNVGGLVGYSKNSSTVTNSYATGNVSGDSSIGGLVGRNYTSVIENCYATNNVAGADCDTGSLAGSSYNGTITNSYATGNVEGYRSGGLIGCVSSSTITGCYATGDIESNGYTGGLIGLISSSTVTNSYATGSIISIVHFTGGLVGYSSNSIITNSYATSNVSGTSWDVGGLVGQIHNSTIENCYAAGNVSGAGRTGGLVGQNQGIITNSYYDTETTGQSDTGKGTPLTTAKMKDQVNFSNWDFVETWLIDNSYPFLLDNEQTPHPGI